MSEWECGNVEALIGSLIGQSERTNELLDRLVTLVEHIVVIASVTLSANAPSTPPDSDLPLQPDGACPSCGSMKVRIPEEDGRAAVRICAACGFAWRVIGDGSSGSFVVLEESAS